MIRPGPPWIERDRCPGGLVLYIYHAAAEPVLITTRNLEAGQPLAAQAAADRELVTGLIGVGGAVCIVVYDGDTGERLRPEHLPGWVVR